MMHGYIEELLAKNVANNIDRSILEMRESYREEGVPTILNDGLNELVLLASIKKPKKILELGTAVGCSGIALLKALPGAVLFTVENRERSFSAAHDNFVKYGVSDRVRQYLGDAEEFVRSTKETFDFVFLDCNKSKYKVLLPLIKEKTEHGGVLFADNVLFRGYVTGEVKPPHRFNTIRNNMREFLEAVVSDKDLIVTVSDVGDGICICYKK